VATQINIINVFLFTNCCTSELS